MKNSLLTIRSRWKWLSFTPPDPEADGQVVKRYGLVFDKRVVDRATFKSYPYGYTPMLNDTDMANVETLVEL